MKMMWKKVLMLSVVAPVIATQCEASKALDDSGWCTGRTPRKTPGVYVAHDVRFAEEYTRSGWITLAPVRLDGGEVRIGAVHWPDLLAVAVEDYGPRGC
ncbi:MAG: hypothetical protein LBR78_03440 [Holosporales bacterium]|jgi:hypothetical protein|nr:hypothetical protein [Holosporales bacterium]